jgi:serine O-acetyltransferase
LLYLQEGLPFHSRPTASRTRWKAGRKGLGPLSQSLTSRFLQVDIHPAAVIRQRDHVRPRDRRIFIGETAVIGDSCSMLHGVTRLGGTGNSTGKPPRRSGAG